MDSLWQSAIRSKLPAGAGRAILYRNGLTAGFTLMEVMIVLLLISMLLGIGAGAFTKLGGGPELARSRIKDVVRSSRYQAVREQAPAVVILDPAGNLVTGVGWRNTGCWHFEEVVRGSSRGFPVEAELGNAAIVGNGVIGNCLDLSDEASTGAVVAATSSLNSVTGISLDLFVKLSAPGKRSFISKGNFYSLGIDEDLRPVCGLKVVHEKKVAGTLTVTREAFQLGTNDYSLPLGRWVQVSMHFNGYICVIVADGIVRAMEFFPNRTRLVTDQATPLVFGNKVEPFNGFIDEIKIGVAVAGDDVALPDTVKLEKGLARIYFDRNGYLDPDFHTAPARILFTHEESGERYSLTVGLYGEVW